MSSLPIHARGLAITLVVGLAVLAGCQPAANSSPPWTLVNLGDQRCDQLGGGGTPGAYAVELDGTWSSPVTVGLGDLPAGVTATPLQSPIAAGSSDGTQELAYVEVDVARREAVPGSYTLSLWADDGTSHQQVPVTLVIQTTRCVGY